MSKLKMIETSFETSTQFHDDMIDNEQVKIKDFTFKNVFGDFRIFNGMELIDMDVFLMQLAEIMNRIKSQDIKDFKSKAVEKIKSHIAEGLEMEWLSEGTFFKRGYRIRKEFTSQFGENVSLTIATIENLIELFDLKEEDFL